MEEYHNNILNKLELAIGELEMEADCSLTRIEVIIQLIVTYLSEIKTHIFKNGFKSNDEEIRFFKIQKPAIVAKLIYYNAIYKIETK